MSYHLHTVMWVERCLGEDIVYFQQKLTKEKKPHSELFETLHTIVHSHTSKNVSLSEIYDWWGKKRPMVRGVPNPKITHGLAVRVTMSFDFHAHLPKH